MKVRNVARSKPSVSQKYQARGRQLAKRSSNRRGILKKRSEIQIKRGLVLSRHVHFYSKVKAKSVDGRTTWLKLNLSYYHD